MKLVKSLLLGSAAGFLGIAGAQAADLPMTKAAPVEYVRVCSVHGAGFFYIPGSDTCIQISGRLRSEFGYVEPHWSVPGNGRYRDVTGFNTYARLNVDARTTTDYGTLRAYVRYQIARSTGVLASGTPPVGGVNSAAIDKAFIQFAGLTAGVAQSFFDFYAEDINYAAGPANILVGSDNGRTNLLAYTATFGGGFSATISLEDRNERNVGAAFYDAAGERVPDVVGVLRVDQDWGAAQLSGAVHQINTGTLDPFGGRIDNEYGWAVKAGVKLKLPMIAAGDYLWLEGTYADGALSYLGVVGNPTIGPVTLRATDAAIVGGDLKTTTGWNVVAAGTHYWLPFLRSTLWGYYTDVNYPSSASATYATLVDWKSYGVGSALIWSPAKAFDIGLEVSYVKLDPRGRVVVAATPAGPITKGSEDTWQARLRLERNF